MKAGQNNKYDITKTSGLVQFWPCPFTTQLFLGRAKNFIKNAFLVVLRFEGANLQ